jgi:hypothetical protein
VEQWVKTGMVDTGYLAYFVDYYWTKVRHWSH